MKFVIPVLIFLNLCVLQTSRGAQLHDRLMTQRLLNKTSKTLIHADDFKERFKNLAPSRQKQVQQLGEKIQKIFPEKVLESYMTWRFISPDENKAIQVLKYALLYRLLILRDIIDSPLSTTEQAKKAQATLESFTQIPEITTDNLWELTHQLIDHKAKVLNSIDDLQTLALAFNETPWLAKELGISGHDRYSLSSLGFINASSITEIPKEEMLSELKNLLQDFENLFTIEARVLSQFSKFEEILEKKVTSFKNSVHVFQIIFHTPEDQALLIKWEKFRETNQIPESKLNFVIAPQTLNNQQSNTTTPIEAAPLYPQELEAISSFGGLVSVDPTSSRSTSILTGPSIIPRDNALKLQGAAASALILGNGQIPVKNWSSRTKNLRFDTKMSKIRLARLLPEKNIAEIRPILVHMISQAQKEILIDQFFLFDAHIVQSLIKRKIQKPQLDVRIFMDHNLDYSMGGFPNTLFLSDLQKNGIKVKARKVPVSNSTNIIIDEEVALLGPQNLIPTQLEKRSTLQAVQVFDKNILKSKVTNFKKDWGNKTKLYEFNIENFRFLTPTKILNRDDSRLLNTIGSEFLRQLD